MAGPRLYYGHRDSGLIYQANRSYADGGAPYYPIVMSDPAFPSGTDGENVFSAVYLTLNQRKPPVTDLDAFELVEVEVRPFVDGVELAPITFDVRMQPMNEASPPLRVVKVYELGLSVPIVRSSVEVGRYAPGGTSFQLRLYLPPTDIQVVEAMVEYDPIYESSSPANT